MEAVATVALCAMLLAPGKFGYAFAVGVAWVLSPVLAFVFVYTLLVTHALLALPSGAESALEEPDLPDVDYGLDRADEALDALAALASTLARAPAAECPICMAHADPAVALACGHAFHAECIGRWVAAAARKRARATCPMCRAAVFGR